MRVGAADTERIDAGPQRPLTALPREQVLVDEEWTVGEVDPRIGRVEMQRGRDLSVVNRQGRLHEARDARGDLQVADVRFDRTDRTILLGVGVLAERLRDGAQLDGIAQHGARAVRFDEADCAGIDARAGQRVADDVRHPFLAGGEVTDLARAVVVRRRAFDDREDMVTIGDGVVEPLEQDQAGSVAEHGPLGPRVERSAVAVGRDDHVVEVQVARFLRHLDRHAPRERHVAFAVAHGLGGHVDGDESRRAGGLHVDAGAAEVELVGDASREVVLVVGHHHLEAAHRVEREDLGRILRRLEGLRGAEIVDEVGVHHRAGVNADRAGVRVRVVAGDFERLPRALQHHALLRIHQRGVAGADAEELGVEPFDVGQNG